ncbi:MAG: exonuclease domain-containing protein [Actinomycetes bacterium]
MFAVIDVETTGFSPRMDRVIEVGVVALDERGTIEWEWTTLINPGRDVGPTNIHRIRPRDVMNAPVFSAYAGYLAYLLAGRVVVGHNVAFDWRMIDAEFSRLGVETPQVVTVCTCDAARAAGHNPAKLASVCATYGIDIGNAHAALHDARATAALLAHLVDLTSKRVQQQLLEGLSQVASWPAIAIQEHERVLRPPAMPTGQPSTRAGTVANWDGPTFTLDTLPITTTDDRQAAYLAVVELALDDRIITAEERATLEAVAIELGITDQERDSAHRTFLQGLATAMWIDGVITPGEYSDLVDAATAIGLPARAATDALRDPSLLAPTTDAQLQVGDRVVFTGDMERDREAWVQDASDVGLRVTGSVSRLTKVVVVADAATQSSKARKAAEFGVRIVSEHAFARLLHELTTRPSTLSGQENGS